MASPSFLRLPIDPTEGFPQAFRLALAGRAYRFRLHANVTEEFAADAADGPIDLPIAGAFLVLAVEREETAGVTTLLRRKVVPNLVYEAAELLVTFRTLRLDRRNLNGIGSFGSEVVGGVALR